MVSAQAQNSLLMLFKPLKHSFAQVSYFMEFLNALVGIKNSKKFLQKVFVKLVL